MSNNKERAKKMKTKKNTNKAKIVRISGIEEWYAPTYESPVMSSVGLMVLYDKIGLPYVYGPEIRKDERLCDDLGCICDRLCADNDAYWNDVYKAAEKALKSGEEQIVKVDGKPIKIHGRHIKITPFENVPPLPESAYAEFGKFAAVFKERVAAI